MKVTYSWIKEFVDVKILPELLGEKLTMAGLSVAALDRVGGDWVYDIEVTSNRPDWLSVRGIAREVAAITGAKLKKTVDRREPIDDKKTKIKKDQRPSSIVCRPEFSLRIEDEKDCGLYFGALITGVKIGPSPKEIVVRLEALGIRPVNNVVDITNICMLEYGQPLHAFDFDRLVPAFAAGRQASIVVRRAKPGEKLVLIDGSEKNLKPDVLVIANASRPIAIAGIMGGRETEVTGETKNILLESAIFDPVVVRRGARILGVATEASYRFERGVDGATSKAARERAMKMIVASAGGQVQAVKVAGHDEPGKDKKIIFSLSEARETLSLALPRAKTKIILKNLGFGVREKKGDIFEVTVPAARRDIKIKEDITEDIARSVGYDLIPLTAPQIKPFEYLTPIVQRVESVVKDLLVAAGCKEAVTYSLISDDDYKKSLAPGADRALSLVNPLSVDARFLRTTLIPSLLKCAATNLNQGNKDFEIFETAHVFGAGSEKVSLGIVLAGNRRQAWQREARPYTFFDLKGLVEAVAEILQISDFDFSANADKIFAASSGSSVSVLGEPCGILGQLSEAVKRSWAIKAKTDIFIAEICLETLAGHARFVRKFHPIIATPCVHRDISLVAGADAPFAKIKKVIQGCVSSHLKAVSLVDSYSGKEIPKDAIGLTISLEYGISGRTLTDQEVDGVHKIVLEALVKELGVTLR